MAMVTVLVRFGFADGLFRRLGVRRISLAESWRKQLWKAGNNRNAGNNWRALDDFATAETSHKTLLHRQRKVKSSRTIKRSRYRFAEDF